MSENVYGTTEIDVNFRIEADSDIYDKIINFKI
jgi:hypothetical protein